MSGGAGYRSSETALEGVLCRHGVEREGGLDREVAGERVVVDLQHHEAALGEVHPRALRPDVDVVARRPGGEPGRLARGRRGAGELQLLVGEDRLSEARPALAAVVRRLGRRRPGGRDQEEDRVVHLGVGEASLRKVTGVEVALGDERVVRHLWVDQRAVVVVRRAGRGVRLVGRGHRDHDRCHLPRRVGRRRRRRHGERGRERDERRRADRELSERTMHARRSSTGSVGARRRSGVSADRSQLGEEGGEEQGGLRRCDAGPPTPLRFVLPPRRPGPPRRRGAGSRAARRAARAPLAVGRGRRAGGRRARQRSSSVRHRRSARWWRSWTSLRPGTPRSPRWRASSSSWASSSA